MNQSRTLIKPSREGEPRRRRQRGGGEALLSSGLMMGLPRLCNEWVALSGSAAGSDKAGSVVVMKWKKPKPFRIIKDSGSDGTSAD